LSCMLTHAKDSVYGSLAECFVTLGGVRYKMLQLHTFRSTYTPNIIEVPILGKVNKGHKMAGGLPHCDSNRSYRRPHKSAKYQGQEAYEMD